MYPFSSRFSSNLPVAGATFCRHGRRTRSLRLALAVCCLVFAVCPSAFGSWTKQRTGSLSWLHSVFFLDQTRGWAVGSRGALLSTVNGGRTWRAKSPPTEDTIRDIHFTDDQNGVIICERDIYDLRSNDEPRAYLLKTMDGGEHWKHVTIRGGMVDSRLMRAVFGRGGRGWAIGEGGAMFITNDAGSSWSRLQAPTRYLLLGGTFINESSGWLVGAGSTILQTTDGGETWHHARPASSTTVRFNATSFADNRIGWAVGSGGTIFRTINGGRSWKAQNSGVSADLFDVKFLNAAEGWAVGAEGTVLYTRDGGLHWISERSPTPHSLERIFFTDRRHGWAVGFGGTIIAYGAADQAPKLRR
jgi:photosystem II stability/assembly factor-like uncharacterized protein